MTPAQDLSSQRLIRLTVLDFGLFDVGPGKRVIGIPGFLLETEDGQGSGAKILFDTGFDPAYATAPQATAARDGLASFGVLVGFGPAQTAAGQLAKRPAIRRGICRPYWPCPMGGRFCSPPMRSTGFRNRMRALPMPAIPARRWKAIIA